MVITQYFNLMSADAGSNGRILLLQHRPRVGRLSVPFRMTHVEDGEKPGPSKNELQIHETESISQTMEHAIEGRCKIYNGFCAAGCSNKAVYFCNPDGGFTR